MKVVVSDTSVLIDLEHGLFLESAFRLPIQFTVPDLLYERELKNYSETDLTGLGLYVQELDGDAVALAMDYRQKVNTLSLPDVFAFALAKINSWMLLSGDRALREFAEEENVTFHGVFWVLDRLHEHRVIGHSALFYGLQRIAERPRCRLPQAEINKRLRLYSDR